MEKELIWNSYSIVVDGSQRILVLIFDTLENGEKLMTHLRKKFGIKVIKDSDDGDIIKFILYVPDENFKIAYNTGETIKEYANLSYLVEGKLTHLTTGVRVNGDRLQYSRDLRKIDYPLFSN